MIRAVVFCLVFLVIACKSPAPDNPLPYLYGEWAREDYLEDLKKTKSPYKSSRLLNGVVYMYIDTTKPHTDSMEIGASWNNHEGYTFYLYPNKGTTNHSFLISHPDYDDSTSRYELAYVPGNKSRYLTLYHYNKSNAVIDSVRFVSVPANTALEPLQYIVNDILIAGSYKCFDSLNRVTTVKFSSEGKISGVANYTDYLIATDFNGGPERIDYIVLSSGNVRSTYTTYGLNFDDDTVRFYGTVEDTLTGGISDSLGALRYTLVKER
ncbi:MAG: hypothetical protein V4649_11470 [Bacteroidota bacterium]